MPNRSLQAFLNFQLPKCCSAIGGNLAKPNFRNPLWNLAQQVSYRLGAICKEAISKLSPSPSHLNPCFYSVSSAMEIAVSTSPNYNPERHLPPPPRGQVKKQIFRDFLQFVAAIPPSRDQMGADQGDSGGRRGSSTSSTLPEPSTKY